MYRTLRKSKNKGQSTVEYVLLFAAVIAVLILFLAPTEDGPFGGAIQRAVETSGENIDAMSGNLTGSH